ncbi:MAG: 50S ribosomal protein L20 [Endomicrobium sp.]|jgi:large subunit ribosomal protein L20|nr:50S ribosomal protein L20 [Endomicrobium sp.]
MRIKSAVYTRQRKKKIFRFAKGYYAAKKNRWRMVKQQVEKSLAYSYVGRKDKKSNFRTLWIIRINAASRQHNISYSSFMLGLKRSNVRINRKLLSEIAILDTVAFNKLVNIAKQSTLLTN